MSTHIPTIGAHIYTQTQSYKFNISSANRDPCVAISQQIMHNASSCKNTLFKWFFQQLSTATYIEFDFHFWNAKVVVIYTREICM